MLDNTAKPLPQTTRRMHGIQVASGSGELFNHYDSGGTMWTEDGDRRVLSAVTFLSPFADSPMVTVGVCGLDSDQARNLRFDVSARNVTPYGFEICFVTWGDTRFARASVGWQAFGPARA